MSSSDDEGTPEAEQTCPLISKSPKRRQDKQKRRDITGNIDSNHEAVEDPVSVEGSSSVIIREEIIEEVSDMSKTTSKPSKMRKENRKSQDVAENVDWYQEAMEGTVSAERNSSVVTCSERNEEGSHSSERTSKPLKRRKKQKQGTPENIDSNHQSVEDLGCVERNEEVSHSSKRASEPLKTSKKQKRDITQDIDSNHEAVKDSVCAERNLSPIACSVRNEEVSHSSKSTSKPVKRREKHKKQDISEKADSNHEADEDLVSVEGNSSLGKERNEEVPHSSKRKSLPPETEQCELPGSSHQKDVIQAEDPSDAARMEYSNNASGVPQSDSTSSHTSPKTCGSSDNAHPSGVPVSDSPPVGSLTTYGRRKRRRVEKTKPEEEETRLKEEQTSDDLSVIDKTSSIKHDTSLQMMDSSLTTPTNSKKKLLILDLNGILVDIVASFSEEFTPETTISRKALFKRPFCNDFLQFCFERFDVGVWSSRTRKNVQLVVNFLMGSAKEKLLFCWDQSHCTRTEYNTIENKNKPLVLKELRKLWNEEAAGLPWQKGDYNESNTVLLDDSPYKALRNPPYTAIFPEPYEYRNKEDIALGPEGDIRVYLDRLAAADSVQKFIQDNPFGQSPITKSHLSWPFYAKVIGPEEELSTVLNSSISPNPSPISATDPTKKCELEETRIDSTDLTLELTLEDADKILKPFTQDQLIDILKPALLSHPDVLNAVRSVADRDVELRKLHIHGIDWEITSDNLRSVFATYGEIEEAVVICNNVSGKIKGYGFITFRHIDGAMLALKEPSKQIDGRVVMVQLASSSHSEGGPVGNDALTVDVSLRKIYVGNLPYDMTSEKLLSHFASYGEIEEGPLGFDKLTGKSKGFAFFVYKTMEGARAALAEPMKVVGGRQVVREFANEGKKRKGRPSTSSPVPAKRPLGRDGMGIQPDHREPLPGSYGHVGGYCGFNSGSRMDQSQNPMNAPYTSYATSQGRGGYSGAPYGRRTPNTAGGYGRFGCGKRDGGGGFRGGNLGAAAGTGVSGSGGVPPVHLYRVPQGSAGMPVGSYGNSNYIMMAPAVYPPQGNQLTGPPFASTAPRGRMHRRQNVQSYH